MLPEYMFSTNRKAQSTPIPTSACLTALSGRLSTFSHLEATQLADHNIPSEMIIAIAAAAISTLRSKSRMDCASCAPAANFAISRPNAGFIPMSSKARLLCRMVNMAMSPNASIPRYFMNTGTNTKPMTAMYAWLK